MAQQFQIEQAGAQVATSGELPADVLLQVFLCGFD